MATQHLTVDLITCLLYQYNNKNVNGQQRSYCSETEPGVMLKE